MSNSKKTKTVSFRIPEHIIAEIEKDAKSELSSTNTLINKILLHYVSWDKYQQRSQQISKYQHHQISTKINKY